MEAVEIVRAHIEAFRQMDTKRSASFLHDSVVADWTEVWSLNPTAYGVDAVVKEVFRYRGTFDEYDYAVTAVTDLGSGQVLAEIDEKGRGKGSGISVERSYAVLYTVIAGRIVRVTTFSSAEAAREALG
jgi:ketosteroid isomerase-like protein